MSSDFLTNLNQNEIVVDEINKYVNSTLNPTLQSMTADQESMDRLLVFAKFLILLVILAITLLFGFLPLLW
jgi:hypothetical protein